MSCLNFLRRVLGLLRKIVLKPCAYQWQRLLHILSFLKRYVDRKGGSGGGFERSIGWSSREHAQESVTRKDDPQNLQKNITVATAGIATICPSKFPTSAPAVSTGGFLDADFVPSHHSADLLSSRRASDTLLRPPVDSGSLRPEYAYSVASRSTQDIGLTSIVSDCGSDAFRYTRQEPREPRSSSRASSRRGISQVATPSRARSRSRAPHSKSPSRRPARLETSPSRNPQATPTVVDVALPGSAREFAPPQVTDIVQPTPERKLYPVSAVERYDRNVAVKKLPSQYTVKPLTFDFQLEDCPPAWEPHTHPEGALYWYLPEKRVYTDAYLCEPNIALEVAAFLEMIDDIIHDRKIQLPENHELVLELEHNKDGTGNYWCYYFVNHERRCLFWLDEFDISNDLSEIKGVTSAAHVKHEIEAKYWAHWEMFPYGHEIPKTVFTELMGIILHGNIDRMTSTTSTVTYDSDELHRMLSLVKSAKELGATDHTAATIGRLMCLFAHHRFLNFHGQHGARLCRDQTIYGQPNFNRSLLMNLLSPLFFNAPSEHLRGLEQIWIDNVMVYSQWKHFIEKLKGEWTDFLLPATVLLNANVAFLAIPSVDPGNGAPEIPRNAAQITSYLSMIFSIGSMILSLLLTRQHRLKNRDSADEVVKYLTNKTHPTLGLETLAIMYSLPYAMLMWATVSFLVAFSFECFLKGDNVSTITTAIAWFAVMSLVGWCVFTAWEEHEETTLRIMWTRFMDAATHVRSRAGGEVAALSKWKAYFDRSPLSTVRGDSPSNRGATSPHLLPA